MDLVKMSSTIENGISIAMLVHQSVKLRSLRTLFENFSLFLEAVQGVTPSTEKNGVETVIKLGLPLLPSK